MKPLLRILLLLLFTSQLHAQCIRLTKFIGDTTYGTYGIYDTATGLVTGGGSPPPPCALPSTTFRTITGAIIVKFKKPVFRIRVDLYGMDNTETISIKVNGASHPLLGSEMLAYTNCGSAGNPPITLDAFGVLHAPAGFGEYNGGAFELNTCNGFDSFEVDGTTTGTGVSFDICVDTVRNPVCLTAHANGPLCVGQPLNLWATGDSAGGTATYYWYGPGGYTHSGRWAVINPSTIANSGKYFLTRTVGTVHDTDTVSVLVKPLPALTIGSNSPLCYGLVNIIKLTASPAVLGETFSWTGPNSFTSVLQNPSISPIVDADTGTYYVTATLNGCTNSASVHVVYAPIPPAPTITGVTTYCTGQTFVPFTVTGGSGSTILWYTIPVGGTGSTTAATISTVAPSVTTEWVSQTILGCESPRAFITVTVNPTPAAPVISGTSSYCQYDPYVLTTAAGTAVLWYLAPVGGLGTSIAPSLSTATPGVQTIYATQTALGCESPRASFSITTQAKPSLPVVIAAPSSYCPGQTFVPFTVISGIGILWYTTPTGGGGVSTAPILSTLVPGVQTVYASQTVLGCESGRVPVSITVIDNVKADFDYKVKYGCKGDTVVFNNKSLYTTTYAWKFGDGFSSILKDPTHIYLIQAIDTVKLYSSVASCIDSSIQYLDLRHPLKAKFDIDTNLICQGGMISFTDTSSIGGSPLQPITRLWSYGDYELHPPVTTSATTHVYPVSGVFNSYLVVKDFVPCTDTFFATINVDSISPISFSLTDTVICHGTYITMKGDYTNIGLTRLLWDLGNSDSIAKENPLVYAYNTDGVFTITERAYYRVCPNTYTTRKVTVLPQPKINLGSDATICKGSESLSISDNINGNDPLASWIWSTGETASSIVVVEPGVYSSTVKVHGCYASASVTVSNDCYINIPNGFTPNGDGFNDYFYPHQLLSSGLTGYKLSVFNRWGVKVFETNSLNGRGWDGKMNDIPQPEGVYVYLIEATFKDGQQERHQGNVTLLR